MEIKVNKEIRNYTESIFFGLSMRQCFFSVLACIVAVCIYFFSIGRLGMELTSWLCMFGAAPFAALGFITYQGMNAEELFVTCIRSIILQNVQLIDQSYNLYLDLLNEYIRKRQKEDVDAKKLCKIKKTK